MPLKVILNKIFQLNHLYLFSLVVASVMYPEFFRGHQIQQGFWGSCDAPRSSEDLAQKW